MVTGATQDFMPVGSKQMSAAELIGTTYEALKAKGHDPVMQIVGYLISGDPTYITSYNNARSLIRRVERDELIEELVSSYIKNNLKKQ